MKKLILLLLFIPLVSFGQYSTYYGTYDLNANVNVTKDVNVSGNINKTITTIDYGALANANATQERNRIESMKIANEREREALIAIANDPSKAFDYGYNTYKTFKKDDAAISGYKKYTLYYKELHKSLFTRSGNDWRWLNISDNFIKTTIAITIPLYVAGIKDKNFREGVNNTYRGIFKSVENYAKQPELPVGEYNEEVKAFIHKKEIKKTDVYGHSGFKSSIIIEDDYEIKISENYLAVYNGVIFRCQASFKGDKNEVTFEQLEGRRYFFRKLIEKFVAAPRITESQKR